MTDRSFHSELHGPPASADARPAAPGVRDARDAAIVDTVLLKWLRAYGGEPINADRMQIDRAYAAERLTHAMASPNAAVQATARRLACAMGIQTPAEGSQASPCESANDAAASDETALPRATGGQG